MLSPRIPKSRRTHAPSVAVVVGAVLAGVFVVMIVRGVGVRVLVFMFVYVFVGVDDVSVPMFVGVGVLVPVFALHCVVLPPVAADTAGFSNILNNINIMDAVVAVKDCEGGGLGARGGSGRMSSRLDCMAGRFS